MAPPLAPRGGRLYGALTLRQTGTALGALLGLAACSERLARNRVLSMRPWKMGTPISMHFSITSRRSRPASRASSVGVRWIAIAAVLLWSLRSVLQGTGGF